MNELEQILEHIDNEDNFLLSGGAGSGKTYSLVQVIKEVIKKNPTERVFCMTYTNSAVKEIEERVNHRNLKVSTIHDFIWSIIKHFQKEIKKSLIALANDDRSKIKIDNDGNIVPTTFFDNTDEIKYKEFLKIKEGIISHDEIIVLSEYMFRTYKKLSDILKDKYKYIFVDEYQDTHKEVVDILLIHLKKSQRTNIIGFFGDAMQSIYENGVNNIQEYIDQGCLIEVQKLQNRRSPRLIYELANELRTDDLIQEASEDVTAPNMDENGIVKNGTIKFIYSTNPDLNRIKEHIGWDFDDSKNVKELNLTHNLIAEKAGFENLMKIYDKEPILALKNSITAKIKDNKKYGQPEVIFSEDETFDNVVDIFQLKAKKEKGKDQRLKKDILLEVPINVELYNQLKDLPFSFVRKIYLDKDQLIDDKKQSEEDVNRKGSKRDDLIKHLYKIQKNISLYQSHKYSEFLKVTDYQIISIQDKKDLKENIHSLIDVGDKTIEQIINDADEKGICVIDDNLKRFIQSKRYIYNRVKQIKFNEFQQLFKYLEGKTPFTTQHKTKGTEFDKVLVILDNGKWNDYNFEYLFNDQIFDTLNKSKQKSYPKILKRTQKIFYVCCTRTKEDLVVFYQNPSQEVIDKSIEWFGTTNVTEI